jgi:hypothetical protein
MKEGLGSECVTDEILTEREKVKDASISTLMLDESEKGPFKYYGYFKNSKQVYNYSQINYYCSMGMVL